LKDHFEELGVGLKGGTTGNSSHDQRTRSQHTSGTKEVTWRLASNEPEALCVH
jgi:hypothetical protein